MTNQFVSDAIFKAFKEEKSPRESIVYDNSGNHLECNEVQSDLGGVAWNEVSFDVLRRNESSLAFLNDDGFRYLLPAYLMAGINHYDEQDVLVENVVQSLTLPALLDIEIQEKFLAEMGALDMGDHFKTQKADLEKNIISFKERMGHFSSEQSKAILVFLHFLAQDHSDDFVLTPIETVMDRYWIQFEDN